MIKDIVKNNQNVSIGSIRKEKMKDFLERFTDANGNVDIENIKTYIEENGNKTIKEGYSLNFLGKRASELLSSLESTTVFVPDKEHNSKEENKNSENIYISADNLEALRHLKNSYHNKIKCIYIDPPYNTGNDGFCYNDKFSYDKEILSEKLGINIDEAERILSMQSTKSNSHSAWLSFMYARLLIASELLTKDGVIFISIDDNEMANLKLLLDDVFSEENCLGIFSIKSTPNGRDYGHIAKQHEYVMMYAKNHLYTETNFIMDKKKKFKYEDDISKFNIHPLYNSNEAFDNENRPNLYYPFYVNPSKKINNITLLNSKNDDNDEDDDCENLDFFEISLEKTENSIEIYPPKSEKNHIQFVWRWGKQKSSDNLNKEIVGYKNDKGEYKIVQKMRHGEKLIRSILEEKEYTTRRGTKDAEELMGTKIFDFPKPVELIKLLLTAGLSEGCYVMDFFAGSGTTAHAIYKLNAEMKKECDKSVKYILVQLPEIIIDDKKNKEKIKYLDDNNIEHRIDLLGMDRIIKSSKLIKEKTSADIDYGFKHYTLVDKSETLDKLESFDPNMAIISQDSILSEFSPESRLITFLCDDGFGLTAKYDEIDLNGYNAYFINGFLYLLDKGFDSTQIALLIEKVDKGEIKLKKIEVFGYAFDTRSLQQLKDNAEKMGIDDDKDIIIKY